MKKIIIMLTALLSLLAFSSCEQSPTEVTVQAQSQSSDFKEVKWIGYPYRGVFSSMELSSGIKLNGIDSVHAYYDGKSSNFNTSNATVCDYIKIRINSAEPYVKSGYDFQEGDVTIIFKPTGSSAECVTSYTFEQTNGQDDTHILQWEIK